MVNRITKTSLAGSTQNEVPVKPVCPNAAADIRRPAELDPFGFSHPSARLESGESGRDVKRAMVAESRTCTPSRRA